jgi:hypothetical protein
VGRWSGSLNPFDSDHFTLLTHGSEQNAWDIQCYTCIAALGVMCVLTWCLPVDWERI